MQFDPYHKQSGTETLLIFTAPGPDGKAASLHVQQTATAIRRMLLASGEAVACPEVEERAEIARMRPEAETEPRH